MNRTSSTTYVKNIAMFFIASAMSIALFACSNYSLVDSVRIKAKPTLYAPLGTKNINLIEENIFPIDDILENLADGSGAAAYRYISGEAGESLKLLLHYPIAEIPINFAQSIEDLDFFDTLSQSLAPQSFKVPDFRFEETVGPEQSLGEIIFEQINNGIYGQQIEIFEPGASALNGTLSVPLLSSGFSSAAFASGYLDMRLMLSTAHNSFELELTEIELQIFDDADSTIPIDTISSDSAPLHFSGTDAGGPESAKIISFNLADITLTPYMAISYTIAASGGNVGNTAILQTRDTKLREGTELQDVTGIHFTENLNFSSNIPAFAENDSGFKYATVGTGGIEIQGDEFPDEWSGISRNLSIEIQQESGLYTPYKDYNPAGDSIDFAGQNISQNHIAANFSVTLVANDARFYGLNTSNFSLDTSIEFKIEELASVSLEMAEDFKTEINAEESLSDLSEWVNSIDFDQIGFKVIIDNGFPAGNNIDVSVNSTLLNIDNERHSYVFGQNEHFFKGQNIRLEPKQSPNLDFLIDIDMGDYDANTKLLTLHNIEPGAELGFSGSVEFIAEWRNINISPGEEGVLSGSLPEDDFLDFSELDVNLPRELSFGGVPLLLFASALPDGFVPKIAMSRSSGGKTTDIIGSQEEGEDISNAVLPDFPDEGEDQVIRELDTDSLGNTVKTAPDFSFILNERPDDLKLNYQIMADNFDISRNDIGDEPENIRLDLMLIIPFEMRANGDVEMMSEALVEEDLFGRESYDEDDSMGEILEMLVSITLKIDYVNDTGLALNARLSAYPDQDNKPQFNKDISILRGKNSLELTLDSQDMELIRTGAFVPLLAISIPANDENDASDTYSLHANPQLSIKLSISAATDIDKTIYF